MSNGGSTEWYLRAGESGLGSGRGCLPLEVRLSSKLTGNSLETERTEEGSKQGSGCANALWLEGQGGHEGLEDAGEPAVIRSCRAGAQVEGLGLYAES